MRLRVGISRLVLYAIQINGNSFRRNIDIILSHRENYFPSLYLQCFPLKKKTFL